jgi:glycosyltransferase involved in cell wall biosynthesis
MTLAGPELVLVACPDARPPAYQAVIGLARAGLLHRFLTGYYHRGPGALGTITRQVAPGPFGRWERLARRRFDPEVPADRVVSAWSYDVALRLEGRLAVRRPAARREVARWRTRRFDRTLARLLRRERPAAALVFSDVGSDEALPACRALGIPYVLSMVHGDVREEREVLRREAEVSPEVFPLYLGDGALDRDELGWLHDRRLRELEAADLVLVPSDHIADTLERYGTPREKVRVIPYAADTRRFRPDPGKRTGPGCTFLFAGGISQRKGVKYLLEAWGRVRRPGWRLQLLGAPPRDPGPLAPLMAQDGVEVIGRVPHAEVPSRMAAADVFVFPSLFEGSAVVTYEALACGLPAVVTPSAGSVVRDGVEGRLVPAGEVEPLAEAMGQLGSDPTRRASMAAAARARAEAFNWPRYHEAVTGAVAALLPGVGAGA